MKTQALQATRRFAILGAAAFLTACGGGDLGAARLKAVEDGTSRDEVLTIMGTGPITATGNDTMRVVNGFRRSSYLVNGSQYEILFYRETPGNVSEEVVRDVEVPVVLKDGAAIGWGWRYFDAERGVLGLPDPSAVGTQVVPPPDPQAESATM